MNALHVLVDAGLRLSTDGPRLIVTPASALTDGLRELIREHKPELWATVRAAECAAPDADRWCWPHSDAMNTAELETFAVRLARFIATGMQAGAAEALADRLVVRDRDADDRVSCAECLHGRKATCPNVAPLPRDVLHRCGGFSERTS